MKKYTIYILMMLTILYSVNSAELDNVTVYYDFNNPNSSIITSQGSEIINGTIINATFVTGIFGSALRFDSNTDKFSFPVTAGMSVVNNYVIGFFIKIVDSGITSTPFLEFPTLSSSVSPAIVTTMGIDNPNNDSQNMSYTANTRKVGFGAGAGGLVNNINMSDWVFMSYQLSGGTGNLFINGIDLATDSNSLSGADPFTVGATVQLILSSFSGNMTFDIDNFVYFNKLINMSMLYTELSQGLNLSTTFSIPSAVNCTGFVSNTCGASCYYNDNFDHNFSISCNDWIGADQKEPINNKIPINKDDMTGLSISINNVELNKDPIDSEQYDSFKTEFDFTVNDLSRSVFYVTDSNFELLLTYLYWENNNIYLIQSGNPTTNLIGSYVIGMEENIELFFDLNTQKVTVVLENNLSSTKQFNFFDANTIDNAGGWYFQPADFDNGDIDIDNFEISFGNTNPTFDGSLDIDVDYTYNPNFFCAFNTSVVGKTSFSRQNCIDRGYSKNGVVGAGCILKACLSDTASSFFNLVIDNIFITIIITIFLILLLPVVVKLIKS